MRSICSLIPLLACGGFLVSGCGQVPQAAAQKPQDTLIADCVALYYKVGDSAYVTRQQHQFSPGSGQLRVTADEPSGRLEYSLRQEAFSGSVTKPGTSQDFPQSFFDRPLATTVFYSMCAAGSLLDTKTMISEDPVKIQGQWYQPFVPDWPRNQISVTLLKNQDTNKFELIRVSEASGTEWLARSYNFRYNSDLHMQLPQTIDVFDAREGVAATKLVVRFQYKNIKLSESPEPAQ